MVNELGIGLSPITETIYIGRQNKAKRMWVGEKKDITDNFIDVMFQYVGIDGVREIEVESDSNKVTAHYFVHCVGSKKSIQKAIDFLQKKMDKAK